MSDFYVQPTKSIQSRSKRSRANTPEISQDNEKKEMSVASPSADKSKSKVCRVNFLMCFKLIEHLINGFIINMCQWHI